MHQSKKRQLQGAWRYYTLLIDAKERKGGRERSIKVKTHYEGGFLESSLKSWLEMWQDSATPIVVNGQMQSSNCIHSMTNTEIKGKLLETFIGD